MSIREDLAKPFPGDKIKWRTQSCGKTSSGNLWARVLAYHTSRLVMNRLDSVVGMENWEDDVEIENGHVKSKLSVRINDSWVTKTGVAEETNIEAVKGGSSDALKRAGVKFGIGRYLYDLEAQFPDQITENKPDNRDGWNKGKVDAKNNYAGDGDVYFYWKPPNLPAWALPDSTKSQQSRTKPEQTESETPGNNPDGEVTLENLKEAMKRTKEEQSDAAELVDEDRAANFAIWWSENIEGNENDRYKFLSEVMDKKVTSTKQLTEPEMDTLKHYLEKDKAQFIEVANKVAVDGTSKFDFEGE